MWVKKRKLQGSRQDGEVLIRILIESRKMDGRTERHITEAAYKLPLAMMLLLWCFFNFPNIVVCTVISARTENDVFFPYSFFSQVSILVCFTK